MVGAENPDRDPEDFVQRLMQKPSDKLSPRQARALAALNHPVYEPPWWHWLDYFRVNKN